MQTILVIIGPSGSGKSSLAEALEQRGVIRLLPTWTTRPPRQEELPGHVFVTPEQFAANRFLMTGSLPGLPYRYGLPCPPPPVPGVIDAVVLRAPYVEQFAATCGRPVLVYAIEGPRDRVSLRPGAEVDARRATFSDEVELGAWLAHRRFFSDGTPEDLAGAVAVALAADTRPRWTRSKERDGWWLLGWAVGTAAIVCGLTVVGAFLLLATHTGSIGGNK